MEETKLLKQRTREMEAKHNQLDEEHQFSKI
jgi:hypothetical protein